MLRVAILGSGRGSNAGAILRAQREGRLGSAQVVGILADHPQAGILRYGQEYGVPAVFLEPGPFKTRLGTAQEQAYVAQLRAWKVDLVVLAGFMRVVKQPLLEAFEGRMINLHPSLLPAYPGLHSIRRAFEHGDAECGCTVHWVNATVDGGAILAQSRVRMEKTETLEQVEEKVHAAEHQLLPQVIAELSETLSPACHD